VPGSGVVESPVLAYAPLEVWTISVIPTDATLLELVRGTVSALPLESSAENAIDVTLWISEFVTVVPPLWVSTRLQVPTALAPVLGHVQATCSLLVGVPGVGTSNRISVVLVVGFEIDTLVTA
jgi:hypothetical protein